MIRTRINLKRVEILKKGEIKPSVIAYWMSRDQRVEDNWALIYAQDIALYFKQPLIVIFCLVPEFFGATIRQYGFMLRGLEEIAKKLSDKNISFKLLFGEPTKRISEFVEEHKIGLLVTDFDTLKIKKFWKSKIKEQIDIPIHDVDAHNIVPCRYVSEKQEYGAYTIRPKIKKHLKEFLTDIPLIKKHPYTYKEIKDSLNLDEIFKYIKADRNVKEVKWLKPGEKSAKEMLKNFMEYKLPYYHLTRNDPSIDGQSNLSPYLHFGQISAQRVALEVLKSFAPKKAKEAFLEELIIRRELSDNFCYYNEYYDSFEGFPNWAKETLNKHRRDKREYLYSLKEFEKAATHDPLWDAAQIEMEKKGKMHGYMRMYWAKKILEWTSSPEEALEIAIYLNNRYEIDGRDPNGYTGIAWSIGGVHDRPWPEKPIFGKIRYMSFEGCKSKFDVKKYIEKVIIFNE